MTENKNTPPLQERVDELVKLMQDERMILPVIGRVIPPEINLIDDFGFDSLGIIELIIAIEEHYNTEVDDSDAEQWKTIGDCAAWINVKGLVLDSSFARPVEA